ncbi:MAG: Ig-like domain-containing protein [Microbacterium sp.]
MTPAPPSRRRPRFGLGLAAVLGGLAVVCAVLGFASLAQGPRVAGVQADPRGAIESSGSRVILTANQPLAAIDPAQVTVDPAVPFTVDAAGRSIGIRFTVPLDDATTYSVTVAGVTAAGGGPQTDLGTSFETPASRLLLLHRDATGHDEILRTDVRGEKAVPVFSAEQIIDFRATSNRLVVAVQEEDVAKLLVMDHDGKHVRELPLPGIGYVRGIQVSERGGLVGYTYSDRELSESKGRASVLVTQKLSGDDTPRIVEVGGRQVSILAWQFVPDSSAVLFVDFDSALSLIDRSGDGGVQSLGLASSIRGISRGTYTAIVERTDRTVVELDLASGSERPLPASAPDYGTPTTITPYPGGTLRHVTARDPNGMPTGQAIVRVGDDGTATPLVEVGAGDAILQACASPSGQYAAVAIAAKLAGNPYDHLLLPLPQRIETRLLDLRAGDALATLTGFDASWCQTPPQQ